MNRYDHRSDKTELIDLPGIPFNDWAACLKELNIINTWMGGHGITIEGIKRFIEKNKDQFTVAEIGCGGGDNLKAIHRWNRGRCNIKYVGIDLNEACIDFARTNCAMLPSAEFICSDYKAAAFRKPPDIIFSSLFCHHFSDEQLVQMLTWMKNNSARGFFINDLQRHPFAYHSIKWLTHWFSSSYLVKYDAPVSVMRGFRRQEWEALFLKAGMMRYTIEWKWAFRYLIVSEHE